MPQESEPFDRALRDFVAGQDLPYRPAAWEQLARRLDAHEAEALPVAPAPPAPIPARPFRLRRWLPVATACAASILIGWGLARLRQPSPPEGTPSRAVAAAASPSPAAAPAAGVPAAVTAAPRRTLAAASPSLPARITRSSRFTSTPPEHAAAATLLPTPVADSAALPVAATRQAPSRPQPTRQPPQSLDPASEPDPFRGLAATPPPERHRVALDVNGGYNLASTRSGFSFGVSLKRPLSRRLQVEAGVAVISGAYTTYQAVTTAALPPGNTPPTTSTPGTGSIGSGSVGTGSVPTGSGTTGALQTEYEESVGRLLYLQAAPTLSYRLTDRFSAGTGVDVQRLLGSPAATRTATGSEAPTQPLWDFGLTGRVDYKLLPRLKTGLQYRGSLGGTTDVPGEIARRNYLLLQVSYSVF